MLDELAAVGQWMSGFSAKWFDAGSCGSGEWTQLDLSEPVTDVIFNHQKYLMSVSLNL